MTLYWDKGDSATRVSETVRTLDTPKKRRGEKRKRKEEVDSMTSLCIVCKQHRRRLKKKFISSLLSFPLSHDKGANRTWCVHVLRFFFLFFSFFFFPPPPPFFFPLSLLFLVQRYASFFFSPVTQNQAFAFCHSSSTCWLQI